MIGDHVNASVGSMLSSSLKKGKKVNTPFNTSPVAPSTYSHIKDPPTATFAINLGKSHEEWLKRNPDFALGGAESDDEMDDAKTEREKAAEQQSKGKKKPPSMNASNEELQQWLDSDEGGGGGELCPKPACVFVVKSLMMNEVLKKIELDAIMAKMQTVSEDLRVSELEEEASEAKLAVLNAQINEMEKHIASMEHKEELIREKMKELKIEKDTFNEKQNSMESVQRECARKLREKQAILAKIIWRKPGEKRSDDEDSFISISALTDSMLIKKTPKNYSEPMPLSASYGKMAGGDTSDYNEKLQNIKQFLASSSSSSSSVHSSHTSPARLGASPSNGDRYIDGRLCLSPMKFASYTPTTAATATSPSIAASSSTSSLLSASPGSRASANSRSLTTTASTRIDPLPSPMFAKPWTAAQVSANYDFLLDKLLSSSQKKKRSGRSSSSTEQLALSPDGYKGYTPTGSQAFRKEEMKKGHIRGATAFSVITSAASSSSLEFEQQGYEASEDEEERTVGTGIQTLSTLSMRSFASSTTSPSTSVSAPAWEQLDPSFYNIRSCNLFGKNRKIGDVRVENIRRKVLTFSHPGMALGVGLERGKEEEEKSVGEEEEEDGPG